MSDVTVKVGSTHAAGALGYTWEEGQVLDLPLDVAAELLAITHAGFWEAPGDEPAVEDAPDGDEFAEVVEDKVAEIAEPAAEAEPAVKTTTVPEVGDVSELSEAIATARTPKAAKE